jgi:hypothetical protein
MRCTWDYAGRRALGWNDGPELGRPEPKFIVTKRGVGYTFYAALEILY